ncbi:hypothetical protein D9M68_846990 [compost metagenome]
MRTKLPVTPPADSARARFLTLAGTAMPLHRQVQALLPDVLGALGSLQPAPATLLVNRTLPTSTAPLTTGGEDDDLPCDCCAPMVINSWPGYLRRCSAGLPGRLFQAVNQQGG